MKSLKFAFFPIATVALLGVFGCSAGTKTMPAPPVHPNLYLTPCSATHMVDVFTPPFSNSSTPAITVPLAAGVTCALSGALLTNNQVVVGTNGNGWYVYNLPLTNASTPVANVTTPAFIGGFAQDAAGDLLVSDTNGNKIDVFVQPFTSASTASFTFNSGSSRPYVLQTNSAGLLFAGNCGSGTTTVYTPPFTAATTPTATITQSGCTEGIGLDGSGNLYMGTFASPPNVWIFNPPYSNASTPVTTITNGPTGANEVGEFAFDASGNIYIANYGGNTITAYSPPLTSASTPLFTIPTDGSPANIFFGP